MRLHFSMSTVMVGTGFVELECDAGEGGDNEGMG